MSKEKIIDTFSDYMNDETRVRPADQEHINFEIALIGKRVEARKQKGLSQRKLADFKVLQLLGYTIKIVPLQHK
jgi:hypothetical protein